MDAKRIALMVVVGFGCLTSCDNRFDNLASLNVAPAIALTNANGVSISNGGTASFTDSVKTSIKHGKGVYSFAVVTNDQNDNIASVSAKITSATGSASSAVLELGTTPVSGIVPQPNVGGQLAFNIAELQATDGTITVEIVVSDAFDASTTFTLTLVAFQNLLPVAEFAMKANKINGDPYEYEFDATKSYDKDMRFEVGTGGIQVYNWIINGVKYPPMTVPVMDQVFPGPGGYQVQLSVTDVDGGTSTVVTQSITLN